MRNHSSVPKRRAFTLTEMAVVLGIVGAIMGGIWASSAMVNNNHKVDRAEQQLLTIVNNVRTLYAARGGVFPNTGMDANTLTQGLVNAGVFPADMLVVGTTTPMSPWATPVTVNLGLTGGQVADGSMFWVDFAYNVNNLPKGVCGQFLSQIASMTNIGLVQVFDGAEYVQASSSVDATSFQNCAGGASFQFYTKG